MAAPGDRIHDLWSDPRDGLPPEDMAWNWEPTQVEDGGEADFPQGWRREYHFFKTPTDEIVKISVNVSPDGRRYFNPHRASSQEP